MAGIADCGHDRRAFLSFATDDAEIANDFRRLIERQHPHLELVDHAAGDDYQPNWKTHCERKIKDAAVLICLLGPSTHKSAPVAWEISRALALGKQVIAVNPTEGVLRVPEILHRHSIEPRSPAEALLLDTVAV